MKKSDVSSPTEQSGEVRTPSTVRGHVQEGRVNGWSVARIRRGLSRRLRLAQSSLQTFARLPRQFLEWRESRRTQREEFGRLAYGTKEKMVIFFIPGIQRVTGGVLQIFSLYRMTREFFNNTDTDALICWLPGEGWESHRFTGFSNDVIIFPFEMVLRGCHIDCELLFHLPEYAATRFIERLGWQRLAALRDKHRLKINILNQDICMMPGRQFLDRLKMVLPNLTCTAGNPVWASDGERKRLDIPIHVLPTWYYPDNAPWQPYESKKDLLIVSPDSDPHREYILEVIRNALPDLQIQVIWGLKYEQYLELERSAKWSLTFGEGLDGYFYGPVLRGGVAFAVRNGTFDLAGLEDKLTIYSNYESMGFRIVRDIRALNSKEVYEAYNLALREPIANQFGRHRTSTCLAAFYRHEFTAL